MSSRSAAFIVEPGERGEVFLDCPVGGCPWNEESAGRSIVELLAAASAHLAAAHPGAMAGRCCCTPPPVAIVVNANGSGRWCAQCGGEL